MREMQRLHATSHGLLALTPHLPSKIRRTKRKILVCLPGLAAGNPRQRVIKGRPSRILVGLWEFLIGAVIRFGFGCKALLCELSDRMLGRFGFFP